MVSQTNARRPDSFQTATTATGFIAAWRTGEATTPDMTLIARPVRICGASLCKHARKYLLCDVLTKLTCNGRFSFQCPEGCLSATRNGQNIGQPPRYPKYGGHAPVCVPEVRESVNSDSEHESCVCDSWGRRTCTTYQCPYDEEHYCGSLKACGKPKPCPGR